MYKWDEYKINMLKEIYPTGNIDLLLDILYPMKVSTIRHKASELKIKVAGDYTDAQVAFIKNNYKTMSYKNIAIKIEKTEFSVRCKALSLGLSKSIKWSKKEIDIIKDFYPSIGAKETQRLYLPNRKETSIINMATKLGIFRKDKNKKYYNQDDILRKLLALSKKLKRTPKTKDLKIYGLPSPKTYARYFGSYTVACEKIGITPNSNTFGKPVICYSKNNDRCLSYSEMIITDFFIDAGIKYKKEVKYLEFMPKEECKNRRVDWIIGESVFVEYFGMSDKEHYRKRMMEKRKLCKNHNILLIELFRKDLKNLHRIFQDYIL